MWTGEDAQITLPVGLGCFKAMDTRDTLGGS